MDKIPELERKPGEYTVPGMGPCGPFVRYMEKMAVWARNNGLRSWAESLSAWLVYAGLPADIHSDGREAQSG